MSDKELLATLYQTIYDSLTMQPKDHKGSAVDSDVRVLMTQNAVINADDYTNAFSGGNPEGDLLSAENFSVLVDKIPSAPNSAVWAPSDGLAKRYQRIVTGAVIDPKFLPTETQEDLYKRLQGYLKETRTKKSIVTGAESTSVVDTAGFAAYKLAEDAYSRAVLDLASVQLNADFSTSRGQREYQIDARRAKADIDRALREWEANGKSDYDEVLDALASIKNDAISAAISDAKATMGGQWFESSSGKGDWMLAAATPSNWMEPTVRGTELKVSSDRLRTDTTDQASSYATSSTGWFWWGSDSSSGSSESRTSQVATSSMELSAELVLVRIQRPWLNEVLFTMNGWSNNGYGKHKVSDAAGGGALPAIPIGFVMARNVSITASFSQDDTSYLKTTHESRSTGGWGWGPFGGTTSSSSSESVSTSFDSDKGQMTISFEDPQIVAWVARLVPACPPI